jgi:hypothetical protein
MARIQSPHPDMSSKGPVSCGIGILFDQTNDVWLFAGAGAPTAGTSGDGAGWANIGSLYTDYTNGKLYINTGTKLSPTWTVVGTQS